MLRTLHSHFQHHTFDALFILGAVSLVLSFLIFPQSLVGRNPQQPQPAYTELLSLFGDSLEIPAGQPQEKTAPATEEGKFDPRKLFEQPDSSRLDTTAISKKPDDSSYVVYLDSTSRLQQFTHVRRDRPYVLFFPDRPYPLFATARPATYQRQVVLDSSGAEFRFTETMGSEHLKIPLSISLHDYIARRRKDEMRKMVTDEARKPKALAERNDLGELLSNITKITIPVPPNPLFSIFGKNEINLNISGAVDIKAGFRNTKSDQTQISVLDQSRNEPDFQQEVQVNVNGMIGDKLSILADWNTQRTFEYENQLKIKYTGYDDEIVRSVEAGNVSLTTPSSFIGSSQALFGIKAQFQTGPLTLTTLASQKKGQIKEVAVSGGAQEVPFEIKPYEYATNHFFVDTSYKSLYEDYYNNEPPQVNGTTQIVEEEVWVQKLGTGTEGTPPRQAVAYITLRDRGTGYDSTLRYPANDTAGRIEAGRFIQLDPSQYVLEGNGYLGVLALNTNVQDAQIVAIAYRTSDGRQYGEFSRDLGDTSGNRPLILKMVKPKNLNSNGPNYPVAWNQLLKNIYTIPGRNIKKAGFSLDIFRRPNDNTEDQNSIFNQRLLRVFELDRFNTDGTGSENGDGFFDFREGRTINPGRAEIVFPRLRPFDDGIRSYFARNQLTAPDSQYLYPQIYDSTRTRSAEALTRDRYRIRGKATTEATSKYSLGFNVVEGSVQVLLDGRRLTPNVDYTVDYIVGEVVIRNDRALVPGANLQIKYEQNDLFQLASKTLLGARGDLAISQNTNFGFTIMNLNQQTLSDKVRLGEEPNNNTILGIDGQTQFNLPFLTNAIDALPLLETRDVSNIRFSGEAAYMIPDPNTKKSTIPSDAGEGIAYIDDFEGARRTIPLGISYSQWYQASPPKDSVANALIDVQDTTKMLSKGKFVWFNRLPTDVKLTDIYYNKIPGNAANNQTTVMDLQYYPLTRGMYNYSQDLSITLTSSRNWGGIMKPISITATNLINENVNFIEIWMKVLRARNADGSIPKLRIDLGTISEDVIPNRQLNSEDVINGRTPNGTLQADEDIGIDMVANPGERGYSSANPDPSGDDYNFDNSKTYTAQEDFSHINGTENNKNSPNGLTPDTEDLNFNGQVDLTNQYIQYELSLDTVAARNPRIVGGGKNDWYQYRIPIREYTRLVGGSTPNFENVESIRLTFLNVSDTVVAVRIADFTLLGNQWQAIKKDDSVFAVTVVSIEDNQNYTSPPGVVRERDKTQPDQEILANEQSLALILKGVPPGESRQAVKYYTYRPLDLFNYKQMKMFVHGDDTWGTLTVKPQAFYRFGLDSLNFYEYRSPIYPGWDSRNEILIRFSELTAIKQLRDSINHPATRVIRTADGDSIVYSVVGNPSLTQVRYLSVGVTNRGIQPLYGQAWYNELRLTEVDDSPGWAYRFDTQVKLADFGTVSFNYSKVDPNFHTLEQRFGSRQTGTNWALNASVQLEKFFPNDWVGTTFPFSYSRTVSLVRPKYLPNSDVLVSEAAELARAKALKQNGSEADAIAAANRVRLESETYRVTNTYAAPNFKLGLPSQAWYVRDTFNKLAFGFNYTRSTERNPATVRRVSWEWNAKLSYALNLSPDYYFQPFKDLFDGLWFLDEYKEVKIYYTPTNFSWSLNVVRARDNTVQRVLNAQETITRRFNASRQFGFGWKLSEGGLSNLAGTYNLTIQSSLLNFETDRFGNQRPFSRILDDIFFGERLINFGTDNNYSQQNQFSSRPNIPNIFNIKKYLDLSLSYSVDYSWQNSLTRGDLGKSAGWNNNISLTMNFKLKQLFDPLFEESSQAAALPPGPGPRGRGRGESEADHEAGGETPKETPQPADTTAEQQPSGRGKTLEQLKNLVKLLIKVPFLDYDNVNITFTQSNSVANSGVVGRTWFVNFWGRLP
ncbi:MAG: hypothetical protein HW412_674, partial [Bacteroidetes bacterium]|nr:hypothetical protein [Bacteroidota bacterium]